MRDFFSGLPARSSPSSLSSIWLQAAESPGGGHTITFDHYSLIIDGQRSFIYSGEFHPFRLPSPDLWRDVFQKMKACGFNTICCYFDWGYHTATPGSYDFSGIRDLDEFLDLAAESGLYVIVRRDLISTLKPIAAVFLAGSPQSKGALDRPIPIM